MVKVEIHLSQNPDFPFRVVFTRDDRVFDILEVRSITPGVVEAIYSNLGQQPIIRKRNRSKNV